jgi:transposase
MAMGQRTNEEQTEMWAAVSELPRSVSHPFYEKLNRLLAEHGFDEFVEAQCRPFYAEKMGRPSLAPGQYFRLLLLGYFECLYSERGIAWRAADSSGVRAFLGLALTEAAPDHSTISRTRRLIDLDTHRTIFTPVCRQAGGCFSVWASPD